MVDVALTVVFNLNLKVMYTVEIINEKGEIGRMFTADLETLNKLLKGATPLKVVFRIQKVS